MVPTGMWTSVCDNEIETTPSGMPASLVPDELLEKFADPPQPIPSRSTEIAVR
jgi:hypothetical protein